MKNLASLGSIYDSTIIRNTCHYNDDIYHIELSNIADCSVTRHRHKQYVPIESVVDSEHHMHSSVDCVACMVLYMVLIERQASMQDGRNDVDDLIDERHIRISVKILIDKNKFEKI